MHGYIVFWGSRQFEVYADTRLEARDKIADKLKIKATKRHELTAVLCEKNGEQVTHSTASF